MISSLNNLAGSICRDNIYISSLNTETQGAFFFPEPSAPLNVTLTNVTQSEIFVKWGAPAIPNGPISGYKIAISRPGANNFTWHLVEGNQVMHKFSNLTAGTDYTVHVLAYNIDEDTHKELGSVPAAGNFSTGKFFKRTQFPIWYMESLPGFRSSSGVKSREKWSSPDGALMRAKTNLMLQRVPEDPLGG